jgi:hypothetical protein
VFLVGLHALEQLLLLVALGGRERDPLRERVTRLGGIVQLGIGDAEIVVRLDVAGILGQALRELCYRLAVDPMRVLDVALVEFGLRLRDVLNAAGTMIIARFGARHRHGGEQHGRRHPRFHLQRCFPLSVGAMAVARAPTLVPAIGVPSERRCRKSARVQGLCARPSLQDDGTPAFRTLGGG